ncbi:MAG: hypothetical protein QM715_13345 [Nibricoccus sp.]
MKNSNRLIIMLALSLSAPTICAWLLAGREFSADLLFGAYTLAGLFFLTAADYAPRYARFGLKLSARPSRHWIRVSLIRHAHTHGGHRAEKMIA